MGDPSAIHVHELDLDQMFPLGPGGQHHHTNSPVDIMSQHLEQGYPISNPSSSTDTLVVDGEFSEWFDTGDGSVDDDELTRVQNMTALADAHTDFLRFQASSQNTRISKDVVSGHSLPSGKR